MTEYIQKITTWPQAAVAIACAIMAGVAFIAAMIALSGSRFPWEKEEKDEK